MDIKETIFYSVASIVLVFYIIYLVWEYAARDVPLYIKILTFTSWILTFSVALILPIDIANVSKQTNADQKDQATFALNIIWRLMYWGSFFLSWLVLPFFQDYEGSGDFDVRSKIRYSLRKNLTIYGVGFVLGIGLVIYLLIKDNFDFAHVEGVLIGVSNFFGLLLVVILLGQGLVAIPKAYYREHNEEEMLEQCYQQAVLLDEQRTEKIYELEECCRTLQLLQNEYSDSEFSRYLMLILGRIPTGFQQNIRQTIQKYNAQNIPEQYRLLNLKILAELNKQVKGYMFDLQRIQTKLNIADEKALKLERKQFIDDETQFETKWKSIQYKLHVIWNLKMRKYYYIILSVIFALLSTFILACELIVFLKLSANYNPYYELLKSITRFYLTELFLLLPLTYMMFCTYYGLFAMKISGLISFNKHHHTDAPSLMFGSINFGRVSFPLCFNFIQITQILQAQKTSFSGTVGKLDDSLFVQSYETVLPLMLLIMCFFNLFNIGNKLMKAIGLGQYAQQERILGMSLEGKKILEKEREQKKKGLQDNQNKDSVFSQELQIYPSNKVASNEGTKQGLTSSGIKNFEEILSI